MRNVRNWWVSTSTDDRTTADETGPRSKDAGFVTTFDQRVDGESVRVLRVEGWARSDGSLRLVVFDARTRQVVYEVMSER